MQFALICRDAKDALEIRLAVRDAHMEGIHAMKATGEIIDGGAILNAAGDMAGSIVLCEFPDRAALNAWLAREVYATEGVWEDIEILEMRRVNWNA